jgi:hypothetical protein
MKQITGIILLFLALILMMGYIDPLKTNIFIYLVVFLIVYIMCALIINLILKVAYSNSSFGKRVFVSVTLAFTPVALLAISTLSSVKLIDLILSICVPLVVVWYGTKQHFKR